MIDFISGFFTWAEPIEEPIDPREDNFNPLDMIIKKDEEE